MAGDSLTGGRKPSLALKNPSQIPFRPSPSLIFAAGSVAGVSEKRTQLDCCLPDICSGGAARRRTAIGLALTIGLAVRVSSIVATNKASASR